MRRRCRFCLHFILIISLVIAAVVNLSPVYAQDTKMCVDPPIIIDEAKTIDTVFTINVNVTDVATGIGGFEFKLKFDTTILNATTLSTDFFGPEGPSLSDASWVVHTEMNNVLGYVYYAVAMGESSSYQPNGRAESGTLATIELIVENVGVTPLDLYDTYLNDKPDANPIPHGVLDGYFSNTGYANPVVDFTFEPQSPVLGETVVFNAVYDPVTGSGSYDIDGYIVSWEWDFGDGATGSDEIVEHVYTEAGSEIGVNAVNVTLTVTDNEGLTSTASKTVPLSGHNLAVINVQANQTFVMQNRTISISVTVKNKGSYNEHCNVTAYYNANPAAPLQTTLLFPKYSKTLTFNWNTSGIAAGPYTVSANVTHVRESGDLDDVESILNDNVLTDSTVTVVLTPVHDIAVIEIMSSPSFAFIGDSVSIDVTVANQGFTPETFNASAYYDRNLIETKTNVTMPALTSQILTFTWDTTSVPWGVYSISVNTSAVPDEINTANNNLTDGTVGIALHNINVLSLSAPTSAIVGTTVTIEADLKNEGRQIATFTVSFYYDSIWITNQTVENLTPSATASLTVSWDTTSVATGPRTIKVMAHQLEGELVVTDNERTQLVSLVPKVHNIAVTSVTANPTTVIRGKTVDIKVTIENLGNVNETVNINVSYGIALIETETGIALNVGKSKTVNFTWSTPADVALKTHTIKAEAQIPEDTDTTDNTKTTQVTLAIHEITVVSVTTSKNEFTAGESIVVTVVVKNQGNFTESFSVTAKYGDNTIEASKNVNNLAKGLTETVTFTWNTAGVTPGAYTIKASASPVQDEENTTNNTQEASAVTINEPPAGIPLYAIVAAAIAIIVVVGVVAYYLKRKKP